MEGGWVPALRPGGVGWQGIVEQARVRDSTGGGSHGEGTWVQQFANQAGNQGE